MEAEMAVIEKFLGQRVEIPEDRRYHSKQGLWAKAQEQDLVFGLTQPALVLAGGVNDLDWLVQDEASVQAGQDVVFVITGKILYISTPVTGVAFFNPEVKQNPSLASEDPFFNPEVKQNPSLASEDPYEKGWLFRINIDAAKQEAWQVLADAQAYIESLKGTEGFKNPEGLQGGVSGICKAVYSGIREQKF
jgi:glycine cleavage system H lipoate-binding protein